MNHKLFRTIDFIIRKTKMRPCIRDVFLFTSFHGLYNDSPKSISEKLHSMYPEIKQYWIIDQRANLNDIPSYISVVKPFSCLHLKIKNEAIVVVDNNMGAGARFVGKAHYKLQDYIYKNRKQIWISTWHGTPVKKLGRDEIGKNYGTKLLYSNLDFISINSDYMLKIFKTCFNDKITYMKLGTPRNDILFNEDIVLKRNIYRKLGLSEEYKYVLYAPTYRNNDSANGKVETVYINKEEGIKLLETLETRFGGKWKIIYRAHQFIRRSMDNRDSYLINGNLHDDMAEYLLISDVLISDYSGSIFDYTITKKPCFIYAPDYVEYRDLRRGLYFSLLTFPYDYATDFDSLIDNISKFRYSDMLIRIKEFNEKIGFCDDGHASERVIDKVMGYINDKQNKSEGK